MTACGSDRRATGTRHARGPAGSVALVASDVERAAGVAAAIPDKWARCTPSARVCTPSSPAPVTTWRCRRTPWASRSAMTQNGANGRTLDEMTAVLGGVEPELAQRGAERAHRVRRVAGRAAERPDVRRPRSRSRAANQLFGQADHRRGEQPFLDALAREYGAGLREVDCQGRPRTARAAINGWTAERPRTGSEIIARGRLNTLTRLVLVNALYLKAPWEEPFEKEPRPRTRFHLVDGSRSTGPDDDAADRAATGRGRRLAGAHAVRRGHPGDDRRAARPGPGGRRGRPRWPTVGWRDARLGRGRRR